MMDKADKLTLNIPLNYCLLTSGLYSSRDIEKESGDDANIVINGSIPKSPYYIPIFGGGTGDMTGENNFWEVKGCAILHDRRKL